MLDKERILNRISILEKHLKELQEIIPKSYQNYQEIKTKRSCERLLQISIECVMEICSLMVAGLKLGLPGEEDDLIQKLINSGIFSDSLGAVLKKMKGFRNRLVHEYEKTDDRLVYEILKRNYNDFEKFKNSIKKALSSRK